MKNLFIVAAAAVLGLSACGGNAKIGGGKQGAAEALMAASAPTKAGSSKATGGVDLTGAVDFTCSEGGTAKLSGFQAVIDTTGGANVSQKFTITYTNCGLAKSDAGTAVYNGTWDVTQSVITSGGNVSVDQKFVGKITVGGAFNDFIDANVTQSVNVSDLGTSAAVSMKLVGTIATSAGSNSYNESLNVTGGKITVDASAK